MIWLAIIVSVGWVLVVFGLIRVAHEFTNLMDCIDYVLSREEEE